MVVNGKVALNPYERDIEFVDLVSIGDMIVANEYGAQFNVTENKEYRLLAYSGNCVKIIDDTGKEDWYSVDYFHRKYRQ